MKTAYFKIIEGFSIMRELQLASHQSGAFQLLQMQMQQGTADAELARKLADIVAPAGLQCANDAQSMRVGQRRQHGKQLVAIGKWGFFIHV